MGFFQTIKSYARIKKGPGKDAPKTQFGLSKCKVNQLIELDMTDFIVNDDYIVMEAPGAKHQVTNIGEFAVDVDKDGTTDITGYRFYMTGDSNEECFLQSFEESETTSPSYVLFRRIDIIEPQSVEEWTEWMGDNDEIKGMINDNIFSIGDITFEKTFTSPIDFVEIIKSGDEDNEEELNTMQLFSREVTTDGDPITEFVMVDVECEEQISIYIGIALPNAGIEFL